MNGCKNPRKVTLADHKNPKVVTTMHFALNNACKDKRKVALAEHKNLKVVTRMQFALAKLAFGTHIGVALAGHKTLKYCACRTQNPKVVHMMIVALADHKTLK